MSRAQLTSTVEQNTGGAVAPFLAGKNKIINGDMAISQRGISINTASGYTLDRWFVQADGTGTFTTTQQTFAPGNAIAGYEPTYYLQSAVTSVGTSTTYFLNQRIEDVRLFAGQTATLSFWAKADSTRTKDVYIHQYFGTGGSADYYSQPSFTVTSSWQRYSYTFTVPSISGKTIGAGSYFEIGIRTSVSSGMVFQVWGVQLEAGSVATPFTTATGTLSGELTACQRYYYRWTSSVNSTTACMGYAYSTSGASLFNNFPVAMRTAPSLATSTVTLFNMAGAGFGIGVTSILLGNSTPTTARIDITASPSSMTAGTCVEMRTNSTTSTFLEFSSEL